MRSSPLRNTVPWAATAMLVLSGVVAAWVAIAPEGRSSVDQAVLAAASNPATKYVGYDFSQRGSLTQVSAQWTVPSILSGSAVGEDASQWVAVAAASGAFIQLGTEETVGTRENPGRNTYRAFWSDAQTNYLPHTILALAPGELVEASMSRVSHGWRVAFTDLTRGNSVDFLVHYARHTRFTTAECLEEDSSPAFTVDPFPALTPVTFAKLRVDRAAVQLRGAKSGPILEAPDGVDIVQTRIHDDSFTNEVPSGRVARYVEAMAPFQLAVEEFMADAVQAAQKADPAVFTAPATHTNRPTLTLAEGLSAEAVTTAHQVTVAARHLRGTLSREAPAGHRVADMTKLMNEVTLENGSVEAAVRSYDESRSWTAQILDNIIKQTRRTFDQLLHLIRSIS